MSNGGIFGAAENSRSGVYSAPGICVSFPESTSIGKRATWSRRACRRAHLIGSLRACSEVGRTSGAVRARHLSVDPPLIVRVPPILLDKMHLMVSPHPVSINRVPRNGPLTQLLNTILAQEPRTSPGASRLAWACGTPGYVLLTSR
jgi:hypothetical protein